MIRPRFSIIEVVPVFNLNDAIIGHTSNEVETAHTRAWAEYRCGVYFEQAGWDADSAYYKVKDYRPAPMAEIIADNDLPF